jgi:predicted nucleotidyltransferase
VAPDGPTVPPLVQRAIEALERHPAVQRVRLVGSRAAGTATDASDWDFAVDTDDFPAIARDIESVFATAPTLAQQWDRLSDTQCWMVILPGPVKVDCIFREPHVDEPAWRPDAGNLVAIDRHFWDWALWLNSKQVKLRSELVTAELRKMFDHILGPMGVGAIPESLDTAVADYLVARDAREREFAVAVPHDLERAVLSVVRAPRA